MLKKLNINGFKSILNMDLDLGNLTLLAGLNNSGKSSIIQSLRMYHAAHSGLSPLLNGHGDLSELRSDFVNINSDISFHLTFDNETMGSLILSNERIIRPENCPEFFYVGADRLGPQPFLPLNTSLDSKLKVGDRGEFVFDFIKKLEEFGYLLPEKLVHELSEGRTFEYGLQGWLSEIAPGIKFSFKTNKKADISHAEINNYRPTNVGFGLSYTLPIIAAILGAAAIAPQSYDNEWLNNWEKLKSKSGVLVVLENPEAHLHPKGQTAMGRLIALAAACGVQIVVETHSEHIMDGIRIAVKNGQINKDLVKFHYLSKDKSGMSQISTPNLDANGKVDFWPEGFFDQTLKNRSILAKRNC
ncbi:DUF3696 domain-containing protein [Acinetobacter baumannii]|nr:DUF3696 domain-containing protein [Acinetobacter baumannii]